MYNNGVSIQDLRLKFKAFLTNPEYLLAILIIAVSLTSFWLGRVSVEGSEAKVLGTSLSELQTAVTPNPALGTAGASLGAQTAPESATTPSEGGYVASKNGTKYHLPWCGSAKQISEQNKIFFATKGEAEAAGYTPAGNCKGI